MPRPSPDGCLDCDSEPCKCCLECAGYPCVCDAPCCLCSSEPCRCAELEAWAAREAAEDAAEEVEEERLNPGITEKRRLAWSILFDPDFKLTRDSILDVEKIIFGKSSRDYDEN